MAIVRTAGTEIIRSASFNVVTSTAQTLILGVQHHIYTVLSVIAYCTGRNGTEEGYLYLTAYDGKAGSTAQTISIADISSPVGGTFVFNDKFSFNGFEPTDFTGAMDGADDQDAIADQGSSVAQKLMFVTPSVHTGFDLHVTYIDANNS